MSCRSGSRPDRCRSNSTRCLFAERGDALDGGAFFIQHLDVEGIGVLTATDRVSLGVQEGVDRFNDFMRTGIQEAVAGVDLVRGFSISEVPEVGGTEGRQALKLNGGVEANRRGGREFGMGASPISTHC